MKKPGQSLVNNFHITPDEKYGAAQVKFMIAGLKRETGSSEQFLIIKMLRYAFDNLPEFDPYRDKLLKEWNTINIDK